LAGAAIWITLALVLAGVAIALFFADNVERSIRDDLNATMNRVVAAVEPATFAETMALPLEDPRYSTPFGGLYWQVTDSESAEIARSRSLWDFEIAIPAESVEGGEPQFKVLDGPADQTLSVLARLISYPVADGTRSFVVVVAEDRAAFIASISRFSTELAVALGILGIVLVAAAWLQVGLGLRSLSAIRAGLEEIRSGRASNLEGDFPVEVEPLVSEVNDLLRSQEASIAFARARASDLAHGLKTPLSVLTTASEEIRAKGNEAEAALIDEVAGDMVDKIDHQLRLSRLRIRARSERYSASVNDALDRTIGVLKRTRAGEVLRWDITTDPDLLVDLDNHDLIELLGVILENAAKWGRSLVTVRAVRNGQTALIDVEDDGPGLPAKERELVSQRGHRADENKAGAGLGLAIAKEIVTLNSGSVEFGVAGSGGLAVHLELPLAR
jgi:signal transduction histidine kinase